MPEDQHQKDIIRTRSALSEGITDAALLYVYSSRYAGDAIPSKIWQDLQIRKINDSLNFIDNEIVNWTSSSNINTQSNSCSFKAITSAFDSEQQGPSP